MGFLSDIGKKTSETTNKITKETKAKLKINENKAKISEIYKEIGTKVYEKHIREEEIDIEEILLEKCKEIDNLTDEIEKARAEILELKDKKQCQSCFTEIELDSNYCKVCGEKQATEEKTDGEDETLVEQKEENDKKETNEE